MSRRAFVLLLAVLAAAVPVLLQGQIRVNPVGVNVNTSGPTTVFLTYGGLGQKIPAEAFWCGELISAAPDIGSRCNPATLFGSLPLRYNLSSRRDIRFTDIMSIPASVARRAYQAAQQGANSTFFYVRRFVDPAGGPDEYVAVSCRLTAGGARSPFALLDVQMRTESESPLISIKRGEPLPRFWADIAYSGTGHLRGRWEIVLPGEDPPSPRDLLTEATLPAEERGLQRRYTELERFDHFLPPTGRFSLPGPDPSKVSTPVDGLYMVLLRIEATNDREGDSDLGAAGAGAGVIHSGGVAGFPLPPLRLFVGAGEPRTDERQDITPLLPPNDALLLSSQPIDFTWQELPGTALYRLEVVDPDNTPVMEALVLPGTASYRAPSWFGEKAQSGSLRWRVVGLDAAGSETGSSSWRFLRIRR